MNPNWKSNCGFEDITDLNIDEAPPLCYAKAAVKPGKTLQPFI